MARFPPGVEGEHLIGTRTSWGTCSPTGTNQRDSRFMNGQFGERMAAPRRTLTPGPLARP